MVLSPKLLNPTQSRVRLCRSKSLYGWRSCRVVPSLLSLPGRRVAAEISALLHDEERVGAAAHLSPENGPDASGKIVRFAHRKLFVRFGGCFFFCLPRRRVEQQVSEGCYCKRVVASCVVASHFAAPTTPPPLCLRNGSPRGRHGHTARMRLGTR